MASLHHHYTPQLALLEKVGDVFEKTELAATKTCFHVSPACILPSPSFCSAFIPFARIDWWLAVYACVKYCSVGSLESFLGLFMLRLRAEQLS